MSNADKPFVMRGGQDHNVALYNRIRAIDRIEFLSGVDLRRKSLSYLKALDLELWVRFYKDTGTKTAVDEEFCQRSAEVIKAMEGKPIDWTPEKENEYQQAYQDHKKGEQHGHDVNSDAQGSSKDVGTTDGQEQH